MAQALTATGASSASSEPATPAGPRASFGLGHGFMLSLLLHGVLLVPWLLRDYLIAPPPHQEQLVVELFGMVSTRQVEEKVAGAETEQPPVAPPPAETPPPAPEPAQEVAKASPVPSPVRVKKAVEEKPPAPPSPPRDTPSPTAPPSAPAVPAAVSATPQAKGAAEAQQQQTLQSRESETDALRRYLGGLRKAIQSHLVYPPELKQYSQVGVPLVYFRLDEAGRIEAGSLRIRQSSGYSMLDQKALEAVQASAPFDRPPRAMEVTTYVRFAERR